MRLEGCGHSMGCRLTATTMLGSQRSGPVGDSCCPGRGTAKTGDSCSHVGDMMPFQTERDTPTPPRTGQSPSEPTSSCGGSSLDGQYRACWTTTMSWYQRFETALPPGGPTIPCGT